MTDKEIKAGLRSLDGNHPFLTALFACVSQLETQAVEAALHPGLNSEQRHYNAGRAAGLIDFKEQLGASIQLARNEADGEIEHDET